MIHSGQLRRLIALIVVVLLLAGCASATRPRNMAGVPTDPSVLFIHDGQLRVQKLSDTTSQVLASNVRTGCVPYVLAPDGSKVAYQDQKGAWWAVPTTGGTPQAITSKAVQNVSWLPSSQGVYYSDGTDIYAQLFDQAKSNAVLKGGGQAYESPTFSPNGNTIGFINHPRANLADVRVAKGDGTDVRSLGRVLLTPTEVTEACPPQILWSPDNARFLLNPGRNAYIFYLAGGTPLPLPAHGAGAVYAWAPDGSKVAFNDGQGTVWLVSAGGTGVRNVADATSGPAWSSDGAALAFVSPERNGSALRTFDVARNSARTVVQVSGDELRNPQWVPGTTDRLVYTRLTRGGDSTIWSASATGSANANQITTGQHANVFLRPRS
jgi:Tol biopolymer transport system component